MTILKTIHGSPMTTVKGICDQYHISDRTARSIIKEIQQHRERYGDFAVVGDGTLKRINILAFTDYWRFRKMLQDKNTKKQAPPYNPQRVANSLGFYGEEIESR